MLTPPSFACVIRVLKEIREGLVSIARELYNAATRGGGSSSSSSKSGDDDDAARRRRADMLEVEINSIIDVEHISQQLLCEVFDWGSFSKLAQSIVSVIERLHQDQKCTEETRVNFEALRLEIIMQQQQLEVEDGATAGVERRRIVVEEVAASAEGGQSSNNKNNWQYVLCKVIRFLSDRLDALRIETANRRCVSGASLCSSSSTTSSSFIFCLMIMMIITNIIIIIFSLLSLPDSA